MIIKREWKLVSSLYTLYVEGHLDSETNIYMETSTALWLTADDVNNDCDTMQYECDLEEMLAYACYEGPELAAGQLLDEVTLYTEGDGEVQFTWTNCVPKGDHVEILDRLQFTVAEVTP